MSRTYVHKGKGYFNNGLYDKPEVKKFLFWAYRKNSERGFFKPLTLKIKEKIAEEDMKHQLEFCWCYGEIEV